MTATLLFQLILLAEPTEFPVVALKPALEMAREQQRFVLAEFWTYTAEPSRSYARKVLSRPAVLQWLGKCAVGARVNADFNKKLRTRFAVKDLPTLLLFDADLRLWCRITGPRKPKEIVTELEAARADHRAFYEAQAILQTTPRDSRALAAQVTGYLRQENAEQAEKALMELRTADPDGTAACQEKLAFAIADQILEPRGDLPGAIRLFALAADWSRTGKRELRQKAVFRLANLKLREGEYEKTVELLELLLKESKEFPDRSKAMFVLGTTYVRQLKNYKKGRVILQQLVKQHADRWAVEAEKFLDVLNLQQEAEESD